LAELKQTGKLLPAQATWITDLDRQLSLLKKK
jgi:hypothetical protein